MNSISGVDENKCCGCGACIQICPQKCITMVENERGFLIPSVDEKKCISCGMCSKLCPELSDSKMNSVLNAYAAIAKDSNKQMKSTSGGVFSIIAEHILNNKGIVIGVAWDSKNHVSHIIVDNIKKLQSILQSKYIQSDTKNTFKQTREFLNKGKVVLYSGTACQIAGLKKYLIKDYENLITVEVACHGVPSPGLFRKYFYWREKKEKYKITEFRFRHRDKHKTGEHYMCSARLENGKVKYYSIEKDPYYNAFIAGTTLRKTCYKCRYKKEDRIADITLCDFWGIEKEISDFPAQFGASAVLINSVRAQKIFEQILSKLIIYPCKKNDIYKHNKSMLQSCKENCLGMLKNININEEELFKKIMEKMSLKKHVKFYINHILPTNVKYKIRRIGNKKRREY